MATAALSYPEHSRSSSPPRSSRVLTARRQAAIVAAVASEKRRAEQRTWLSAEIQKGLDSGTAGPLNIDDVIRRGRGRLAARKRSLTA